MASAQLQARIDELAEEISGLGRRFAEEAAPRLARALERSVEELVVDRAESINRLDSTSLTALRRAVVDQIQASSTEIVARLQNPDLWLRPTIEVGRDPAPELDHPNHRVWIALLNGADGLDPVLTEFGLTPSFVPDPGGGHFGLQPSLQELDSGGGLSRLWRRYVGLYQRYRELLQRLPEEERSRERERALRRWRDTQG